MSDTPRTDAKAQFFGFNPDEGEEFVQADFARELERENAALRAVFEAAKAMAHYEYAGAAVGWPDWDGKFEVLKAAVDAARKGAQP
jgi:hypothetical protein